jgi:predicted naringenin-chalcone synthase
MFIIGLGTAAPPQRYTQRDSGTRCKNGRSFPISNRVRAPFSKKSSAATTALTRATSRSTRSPKFLTRPPTRCKPASPGMRPRWPPKPRKRALKDADCRAEEIDAVLISTCTGYLCPGLTSYVSEQLGLRENIFALDLVGQGCGAALPNLRAANPFSPPDAPKKFCPSASKFAARHFFSMTTPAF